MNSLSRARNCTIRRAGPGRSQAASTPHATFTRRRCCQTAWSLLQGDLIATSMLPRARNCTIRRAGPGLPPAASTTHAFMHTATLLPNGMVLVAGGRDGISFTPSDVLASAELYDPASGTWTATGSLNTARDCSHGDVAAKRHGPCCRGSKWHRHSSASAELYDPASGTWTAHGQPQHRTL